MNARRAPTSRGGRPRAAVVPNASDKLLAEIGAEFAKLDARLIAQDHDTTVSDADRERLFAVWWGGVRTAATLRARTAASRSVKARMLLAVARVSDPEPSVFLDLALSIAADTLR